MHKCVLAALFSALALALPGLLLADTPPVFDRAWTGSGSTLLSFPQGIAVENGGTVYVADTGNDRIEKFNSIGTWLFTFGTTGADTVKTQAPQGLALSPNGSVLYVCIPDSSQIRYYNTSTGAFLGRMGLEGSGDGQLNYPTGVAVDASGNVYVADSGNDRVEKFSSSGAFMLKFGSTGSANGQFSSPEGVAVDAGLNIYVTDNLNSRVQKFNSAGTWQISWGSSGSGAGQFNSPYGIAVEPTSQKLWVVDQLNARLQKFNSAGSSLAQVGSLGGGNGQLDLPWAAAIDGAGNIYVADTDNARIEKFQPANSGAVDGTDSQFTLSLAGYPNPAQMHHTLKYVLPAPGTARLEIYSVSGKRVRGSGDLRVAAGEHTWGWDLRSDDGQRVPAGVYLARLSSGNEARTAKIVLTR